MNKAIDSNLLSQAFGEYEKKLSTQYSEESSFEPSEKFNKDMQKLIKSQTNIYHKATLTKSRRILVAAALIVMIMAASLSVEAIREKIFSFFITSGENYSILEHSPDDTNFYHPQLEKVLKPSYIPEGYELSESRDDTSSSYICYIKDDDYLTIEQFTASDYKSASDIEFKTMTREDYEGTDYIIKTDEDMTMLIWERDGYVFEAVGYEGTDEILKVAASVK